MHSTKKNIKYWIFQSFAFSVSKKWKFLTAFSQVRDPMYAEREVVTERLYNYKGSAFFLDVSHHLR